MIKKDRNSWIAVIFLIYIFTIPIRTMLGGSSEEDVLSTNAEAVLSGSGTAAEQTDITLLEENVSESASEDEAKKDEKKTVAENWQETFLQMQDRLNVFTEKLFLRNAFISLNSELTRALTGGTYMESTQVLLGKDDWLFYKAENDGQSIYDYMGINRYDESQLRYYSEQLAAVNEYVENKLGIRFVMTLIPNKEIVYEEYMPDTIARVETQSRGEQIAEYIQQNTNVTFVYPKNDFAKYKDEYQLYYNTDTHWNQIGAFVGLQAVFAAEYGMSATPDSVDFIEREDNFAGDLAVIAGEQEKYAIDQVYEFDPASIDKEQYQEETAVIVGDSFSGFLSTIAKGYYKEVYRVNTKDFTPEMLEEYDADILIWETVERYSVFPAKEIFKLTE